METISIKPTYSYSIFSLLSTSSFSSTKFTFKFTPFRKQRQPLVCSCFKSPPSPQNPSSKPQSRFWVLRQILQNVKDLTLSHTPKWGSSINPETHEENLLDHFSNSNYLQSNSIGLALLSITSNAKVKISPFVATLAANPTFVSGMLAWVMAQSMKVVLNFFLERKWDLKILFASGGMPSSHSALCTALTTSVALCHGVADSLFPVCLGFSSIVMYDAIGVRRHAGMQAEVLNMIVEDLFQGHPISQRKLKELLGHTPSQVLAGALLGIAVAYICCQGCLVAT